MMVCAFNALTRYQAAAPKKTSSGWMGNRRRSMMFSRHSKKVDSGMGDKDVQAEIDKLLSYLKVQRRRQPWATIVV